MGRGNGAIRSFENGIDLINLPGEADFANAPVSDSADGAIMARSGGTIAIKDVGHAGIAAADFIGLGRSSSASPAFPWQMALGFLGRPRQAAENAAAGEYVRKKVFQTGGIMLEWQAMRVGEP